MHQDGTLIDLSNSVAISDSIKILSDLSNRIPDKSWMLYLLELFNKQHVPIELNLICSFNDDGKFHAIFGGVNRYEFKIKPVIGHSYLRQIILERHKKRIAYRLLDEVTGQSESFFFDANPDVFDFFTGQHFTGIEWHNRIENNTYPVRYEVEVSNLAYGIHDDPEDPDSVEYLPYNHVIPDIGGLTKNYHISFSDFKIKNGFVSYKVGNSTGFETIRKFFG